MPAADGAEITENDVLHAAFEAINLHPAEMTVKKRLLEFQNQLEIEYPPPRGGAHPLIPDIPDVYNTLAHAQAAIVRRIKTLHNDLDPNVEHLIEYCIFIIFRFHGEEDKEAVRFLLRGYLSTKITHVATTMPDDHSTANLMNVIEIALKPPSSPLPPRAPPPSPAGWVRLVPFS